jgi:hypothetical protein
MDYDRLIEYSYNKHRELNAQEKDMSRLEYLGEYIFDFTTYDSDLSEFFAKKAIEICKALVDRTTYQYIDDPENCKWYTIICHMPFFSERINWGGSIRGAWWDHREHYEASNYGLYDEKADGRSYQQMGELHFTRDEWIAFVTALINFAKVEMQ